MVLHVPARSQISIVGVVGRGLLLVSAPERRNKIAARTKTERPDGLLALLFYVLDEMRREARLSDWSDSYEFHLGFQVT